MNTSLASNSSYGFSPHSQTFNPPRSTSVDTVAEEHTSRAYILPRRTCGDWVALGAMLLAACAIFFINLTASGYANEFYSAAAQAGSVSWKAMFRFNNPDALLVLLMTGAANVLLRSLEYANHPSGNRKRTWWMVLASALIGFGFLPSNCRRCSYCLALPWLFFLHPRQA